MKVDLDSANDTDAGVRLTRAVVRKLTWTLGGIGTTAALLGFVIGLVMANRSVRLQCLPSQGQVGACYSHPNFAAGSAIAFMSLGIAALVLLACVGLRLLPSQASPTDG